MSCPDGAADALEVDAAVLVEALVLDRDHRLLHHRGDLTRRGSGSGPRCWSAWRACCRRRPRRRSSRPCSYWARFSSEGRSWATAIMIPKIQETNASRASPRTTRAKRSFLSRGRVRPLGSSAAGITIRRRRLNRPPGRGRADSASGGSTFTVPGPPAVSSAAGDSTDSCPSGGPGSASGPGGAAGFASPSAGRRDGDSSCSAGRRGPASPGCGASSSFAGGLSRPESISQTGCVGAIPVTRATVAGADSRLGRGSIAPPARARSHPEELRWTPLIAGR